MLETVGDGAPAPAAIAGWRASVLALRDELGWPAGEIAVRTHATGAALAFEAPLDQLFVATEVNEWAWLRECRAHAFHAPGHAASWDEDSARHSLRAMAAAEANPRLRALVARAGERGLPELLDEDFATLGLGEGGRTWPIQALPAPDEVPWAELHAIPTALVTGSNGKTTTVRLLSAMLRAHGWRSGHCCTDGVYVDGEALANGDWSGPGGARAVLRDPRVQAAVLETARGGLLRRGLALAHADAAVVTNVSADHYGEYGIHDLDGLADVKLTLARALGPDGVLVLNGDDETLVARGGGRARHYAWFAHAHDHPRLQAHRAQGGATCGVRDGVLCLSVGATVHALADVAAMPLTAGGLADYNIGNAAAASLLAQALGVAPATIASVLSTFGADPADNPGRLQRWNFGGLKILLDYAHNPDGLRGLLKVARAAKGGRLGLLLGQAGNRPDADVRALAGVAAEARPDFVVLKDIDGYLRGREPGAVAAVLGDELRRRGHAEGRLATCLPELGAARMLLAWSRPGDVLVMPVHALSARASVGALLDALTASGWQPGEPLPAAGVDEAGPPESAPGD